MAIMWTTIIKNSSGGVVNIEDLGVELADATTTNFHTQFDFAEVASSDDLRTLVAAGTLIVNDGTADLSSVDGANYLTFVHQEELKTNYWDKAELAAGNGVIHWNNISGAPSFGDAAWIQPVLYFVRGIGLATAPATPVIGDVYVDNVGNYLKYNGATWTNLGAIATGDRVVDLSTTGEDALQYNGASWVVSPALADNNAVTVNDDGDGKAAQYVYDLPTTTWSKVADVDFSGHFDGGASKHDATEIDVEGTYINIAGSPTDLESALSSIDTTLGTALSQVSNTLDNAYDQGGAGVGRTINTTDGAVVLASGTATNAPLQITPQAAAPSTGLADGQMTVVGGILYVYDATRTKWLSVQRLMLAFGRKKKTRNQYLAFFGGNLKSNNSGIRLPRNATIVSMSGQFDVSGTGTFNMRKNDAAANISNLTVTNALGNHDITTNIDTTAGDYLQCYLSASVAVEDPFVICEVAYRI